MAQNFSHSKDDAALCQNWTKGACPQNNVCNLRHYYLEKDAAMTAMKPPAEINSNNNTVYSSPLVVKVKTLTESRRREEVDLETGKRRSWVESTEFDVLDLTGWISCILVF